ncbi:MAG: hypothetical protein Q3983_09300 [Capnocytophaga sp.]|nr:hypothetical protein [Capnocytophaga sp.]
MKKIYFILFLFTFYSTLNAQRIYLVDSLTLKPIQSVVVENGKGEIVAISDEKGSVKLDNETTFYTSHISYNSKKINKNKIKEEQKIVLSTKKYEIPEIVLTNKAYDYTLLKTYIRTYQYADSIPVYYTEGWVDFYIPKKGNNLKYNILALKCYENIKDDKLNSIKKGTLFMGQNGLINFLKTNYFPLEDKKYSLIKKSEDFYNISYNGKEGAGKIEKGKDCYEYYLNNLFPKEKGGGSFAGRTNIIHNIDIYQKFQASKEIEEIDKTDFDLFRYMVNLETIYKEEKISLVTIYEIYPVKKVGISKNDIKEIRLQSSFGGILSSQNIDKFNEIQEKVPAPSSFSEFFIKKEFKLLF